MMTGQTINGSEAPRKPRIALMGEFSSGKSTLANLLLQDACSQVQVTATQMPPVWYVHGDADPVHIAKDGSEEALDTVGADGQTFRDTFAIRRYLEADILETCDIIDMPGSSDPNLDEDIWTRMLPEVDIVLWCTPATQAWRQSEAGMWEGVREDLFARSVLLITRIDKILTEEDRSRLVKRVKREVGTMFREVFPVSLVVEQREAEDVDVWYASGLEPVLSLLFEIVEGVSPTTLRSHTKEPIALFGDAYVSEDEVQTPHDEAGRLPNWASSRFRSSGETVQKYAEEEDQAAPDTVHVVPRRVVLKSRNSSPEARARRAPDSSLI